MSNTRSISVKAKVSLGLRREEKTVRQERFRGKLSPNNRKVSKSGMV